MAAIIPNTFGDMKRIVYGRASIAGEAQPGDAEFVETAINEYWMQIATERAWRWRKDERAINFNRAITTGTSAVTNGTREVVISGLTLDNTYLHRSIRFSTDLEIYHIIGIDLLTNKIFLNANYVGTTAASASHKIYKYEFALPPDLDTLEMVYIDTGGTIISGTNSGELDVLNVTEFNRALSIASTIVGPPVAYTRDGNISAEDLPPLDDMVADYDFLGGEQWEKVSKLRLFPIEPDRDTLIHLDYTLQVEPMLEDTDKPLMPIDDRWTIIHYALGEWWKTKGAGSMADREFKTADGMLASMRQEFHATDVRPKFVVDTRRNVREHGFNNRRLLHWISRQLETGGA